MNKIYIIIIIILIQCIIRYIPYWYWFSYIQSYKYIHALRLYGKLMIGMMTIDRDIDIAEKVFSKIKSAITHFNKTYPNIIVEIVVITRETDKSSIAFWNSKSATVLTVPHYDIIKRHNMKRITDKSNRLVKYAIDNKCNYLMFVESDVGLLENTITHLFELLSDSHVSASCGPVPWANETVAYMCSIIPKRVRLEDFDKPFIGLGTSAMAMMCNVDIFQQVEFECATLFGITGQDVGFFRNLFRNRYKLLITNETVEHYYNR